MKAPHSFIDYLSSREAEVPASMDGGAGWKGQEQSALLMSANDSSLGSINLHCTRRLQQWQLVVVVVGGGLMEENFQETRHQQHKGHPMLIISHVSCADFCVNFDYP